LSNAVPKDLAPSCELPLFRNVASKTGKPIDRALRTIPSGTPSVPAILLAMIGVKAPVAIFIMFIFNLSRYSTAFENS
jgi:hypothetical protein